MLSNGLDTVTPRKNAQIYTQTIETNIVIRIRTDVKNVVAVVENSVQDTILTAKKKMVMLCVEIAVMSVTESSRHGQVSGVQNLDQMDFSGNAKDTPLMTASGCMDMTVNQNKIDDTRIIETTEDGSFPILRPNFEWQPHTDHNDD